MLSFLISMLIFTMLFGLAYKITGAILKACLWLFILLPLGVVIGGIGILLCCTIILIPVGLYLIKAGFRIIIPG